MTKTSRWLTSAPASSSGSKNKIPTPTSETNVTAGKHNGTNRGLKEIKQKWRECRLRLTSLTQARKTRAVLLTTSFRCSMNRITEVKFSPVKTKTLVLELLTALRIFKLKETGRSIF